MRKIIVLSFISLDGVMQAPGGPERIQVVDLNMVAGLSLISMISQGKLFKEGTIPAEFKLTESVVSPSGVIFANYKRGGEVKTGSFADE